MRTKLVGALTVGLLALGACSDGDDKNALTDTSQAGGQTTEAPSKASIPASDRTACWPRPCRRRTTTGSWP